MASKFDQTARELKIRILIAVLFLVLLIRLFQLQVIEQPVYSKKSAQNHIRQIPVPANRGLILDRNGEVLVENRASYSLYLIPYEFEKNIVDAELTAHILQIPYDAILEKITHAKSPFNSVLLQRGLSFKQLSVIEENRSDLVGVYYQVDPIRSYPTGIRGSHVFGYLGEVTSDDMSGTDYIQGELAGKTGIEKIYESVLHGKKGYRFVEVDVRGKEVGNFNGERDVEAVTGQSIRSTLDASLQLIAEKSMTDQKGALVAMDPSNGDILAMVSMPDYDLAEMSVGMRSEMWDGLNRDSRQPLFNRAIQGQLPPGSTFKLVSTITALENNWITPKTTHHCPGGYYFGRKMFACWKEDGHGMVNLIEALQKSCNVYFFNLHSQFDLQAWDRMTGRLGFGKSTGIDLPNEAAGLIPDAAWMNRRYGPRGWGEGNYLNLLVGQGDILVTPLQMVSLAATIANRGEKVRPRVVQAIQINDEWLAQKEEREEMPLSETTWNTLIEGMERAVYESGGTAGRARVPGTARLVRWLRAKGQSANCHRGRA